MDEEQQTHVGTGNEPIDPVEAAAYLMGHLQNLDYGLEKLSQFITAEASRFGGQGPEYLGRIEEIRREIMDSSQVLTGTPPELFRVVDNKMVKDVSVETLTGETVAAFDEDGKQRPAGEALQESGLEGVHKALIETHRLLTDLEVFGKRPEVLARTASDGELLAPRLVDMRAEIAESLLYTYLLLEEVYAMEVPQLKRLRQGVEGVNLI